MEKQQLRGRQIALRKALKDREKDQAVFRSFFHSPLAMGESFFVYLSVGSETDTRAIVAELLRRGKTVCVPRIAGGEMAAVPYTDRLIPGPHGIPMPETGEDTPCDVVLAPLLAFDREGYRLGYGGGYYDRYFAGHENALRIGLAYAGQAAAYLPHDPYDLPLDAVITEEQTVRFCRRLG